MAKQRRIGHPQGGAVMQNEAESVIRDMELAYYEIKKSAAYKVKGYKAKLLNGSYNIEVNGYTLVFQYYIADPGSVFSYSFGSMAIYNLTFNEDGKYVTELGLPGTFPIDQHLLHYKQYELYSQDGLLLWVDSTGAHKNYSQELVSTWVNELLRDIGA